MQTESGIHHRLVCCVAEPGENIESKFKKDDRLDDDGRRLDRFISREGSALRIVSDSTEVQVLQNIGFNQNISTYHSEVH